MAEVTQDKPKRSPSEKNLVTASSDPPASSKSSGSSGKYRKLKEDYAAAKEEIARLIKENEDLKEKLETLESVISVQHEQRSMQKKTRRARKDTTQTDADSDEEFSDQETETFDKAVTLDDTRVATKSPHKRTRSNQLGSERLTTATAPPPATTANGTPITDGARKMRPVAKQPVRQPKYQTASAAQLMKVALSAEDQRELSTSTANALTDYPSASKRMDDPTSQLHKRVISNFGLLAGERRTSNRHDSSTNTSPIMTPKITPTSSPTSSLNNAQLTSPPSGSAQSTDHPRIFDENTVLDILTGLGITSSRQFDDSAEGSVLIPKDFSYSYQFKVRRTQDQLLKFKDFAPKVFHQIRKHFGVTEAELLFSFRYDNLDAIKGSGKSGAFFIFTKDKKYILKTATGAERDFLWEMLPYYLVHVRKYPNTVLPRYYGVYSMKHEGIGGMVRFVIMNNWFNTGLSLDEKYDLKGSTVGRTIGVPEDVRKAGSILKDLDIKRKVWYPEELRGKFLEQLKIDAAFLAEHNVMDYSLLVGIHPGGPAPDSIKPEPRRAHDHEHLSIFQQTSGGTLGYNQETGKYELYFIGIIDVLVQYSTMKKMEHFLKSIRWEGNNVSVVQPAYYSRRFVDFITGVFAKIEKVEKKKKRRKSEQKTIKNSRDSKSSTTTSPSIPGYSERERGDAIRDSNGVRFAKDSKSSSRTATTSGKDATSSPTKTSSKEKERSNRSSGGSKDREMKDSSATTKEGKEKDKSTAKPKFDVNEDDECSDSESFETKRDRRNTIV